jgi:hypothetical protein
MTDSTAKPGRPKLTPADAAALYVKGMSACDIAAEYGVTRSGAEAKIRAGGAAGLRWCRVHRTWEELRMEAAPPPPLGLWGAVDAPEIAPRRPR